MNTANYPSIDRIAELQQFVADFASILRVPHLADKGRAENDVEHSFGLALTCWFIAPKIAPTLNMEKIFKYALAHDTVEIHAGDTFVFGPKEQLDSKSEREDKAIDNIAAAWADFAELVDYAKGYKNKIDEEAKFVYAVDKLLPVIMVDLGEKKAFWKRHNITLEMEKQEKESKIQTSTYVAPYYEALIAWLDTNGHILGSSGQVNPSQSSK